MRRGVYDLEERALSNLAPFPPNKSHFQIKKKKERKERSFITLLTSALGVTVLLVVALPSLWPQGSCLRG